MHCYFCKKELSFSIFNIYLENFNHCTECFSKLRYFNNKGTLRNENALKFERRILFKENEFLKDILKCIFVQGDIQVIKFFNSYLNYYFNKLLKNENIENIFVLPVYILENNLNINCTDKLISLNFSSSKFRNKVKFLENNDIISYEINEKENIYKNIKVCFFTYFIDDLLENIKLVEKIINKNNNIVTVTLFDSKNLL